MKYEPIYYGDYLKLDEILNSQMPKSKEHGNEAHDETLFIIVHQAYELWFKQIIHEVNSIYKIFDTDKVAPNLLNTVTHRLNRIIEIQRILNGQLRIIETMTPLDFMDFRDYLVPASGFQSIQFRIIELSMGLREEYRIGMAKEFFNSRLSEKDRNTLIEMEKQPTLLELIDNWLSGMPFAQMKGYSFWDEYLNAVYKMLDQDEKIIQNNSLLHPKEMEMEIRNLKATRATFENLFDEEKFDKLKESGLFRMSREANLSLIFIKLFSDEPILQLPNRIIDCLIDIDEMFTTWRYQHSIMAHRMLGTKIGTGGSSGHEYLKKAAENNRVFVDMFNMSTFLIPKSFIPTLPNNIRKELGFVFE